MRSQITVAHHHIIHQHCWSAVVRVEATAIGPLTEIDVNFILHYIYIRIPLVFPLKDYLQGQKLVDDDAEICSESVGVSLRQVVTVSHATAIMLKK